MANRNFINLNLQQKGVYGLESKLSQTNGQVAEAGTAGDIKLFQFYDNDGKNFSNGLSALYNTKTGSVEYVFFAKDKNNSNVSVQAYDTDGDGNIDYFKQRGGCDSPSDGRWATYANPKDDGMNNFQPVEKGSSWNPLNWFK